MAFSLLSEQGPDGVLSRLLLWVLGFFFLIIVVGWLASLDTGNRPKVRREAREPSHKDADDAVKGETKNVKSKSRRRK